MTVTVSAFYKFVAIADPAALRDEITEMCRQLAVMGTVLVANEGINATVSGADENIIQLLGWLRSGERFHDLQSKESLAPAHPFKRLKVKVKPEIVTFGHPGIDPALNAGTYVCPEDWNALIQEPDVIVVDTRNTYEVDIGTFPGAIDPKTQTFSDFAAFADAELSSLRNQKIAMFCTGGIRCEKATAYLRAQGFKDVYHLQGGILKYLEAVPEAESLWQGECFIFDERVALEHGVKPAGYGHCSRCGWPVRGDGSAGQPQECVKCSALNRP
jgi:UPF0176 protein